MYIEPYSSINWPSQRNNVAATDIYTPHTWLLNLSFGEEVGTCNGSNAERIMGEGRREGERDGGEKERGGGGGGSDL